MSIDGVSRRGFLAGASGLAAAALASGPAGAEDDSAIPFTVGTNPPSFRLPPNACDVHFHIYDSRFPAAANASLVPPDASVSDYLRLRKRLGTARGVVVLPSTYGTDNASLLAALEKLGQDVRGVAVVDTSVADAELKRLDAAGVRGIRFNLGRAGATTVDMIAPLARRVADLGWHVQVHMKGDQIAESAAILRDLPVPVVFDHLGRVPMPDGRRHPAYGVVAGLLEADRAYVKISSLYQDTQLGPPTYDDVGDVARGYIDLAPERVLWGSDWPHPSKGNYGTPDDALLLDLVAKWAGGKAPLVFVENPARLYGF